MKMMIQRMILLPAVLIIAISVLQIATAADSKRDHTPVTGSALEATETPDRRVSRSAAAVSGAALKAPEAVEIDSYRQDSVTIRWTGVNDSRLHSYNLALDRNYHGYAPVGETRYTFTGLTPGVAYEFGVRSVEVPAEIYSPLTVIRFTTPEVNAPLAAPSFIQVTDSTETSVTVSWIAVNDPRLHSYNLALDGEYDGYTSTDITTYTFYGLIPGKVYEFGVRSVEVPAEIYSRLTTTSFATPIASACAAAERYNTAEVNGDFHAFVDTSGTPKRINGVNIRSPLRSNNASRYDQMDYYEIRNRGFDHVRLALYWYEFEPAEQNFNLARLTGLDSVIDLAEEAGLGVIIDPIHLSGSRDHGANVRGIPAWAWGTVVPDKGGKRTFAELDDHALPYLQMLTSRYCDNATVIAIDLVNEPRESDYGGSSLSQKNDQLVSLYRDWIGALRAIDPNKILLIEPFYGSARISSTALEPLQNFDNIVWSMHDYYAGEGRYASGYKANGYPYRDAGARRTEYWESSGEYPDISAQKARQDMILHLNAHKTVAAAVGLPAHVGEYGMPLEWGSENRYEFLCDKTRVYSELKLPATAWVWNSEIDRHFGMWSKSDNWESWTSAIFDCQI